MTALAADSARPTKALNTAIEAEIGAAANAVWYAGSVICNVSGYGDVGADTSGHIVFGIALEGGNNTGGSNGDVNIKCRWGHMERFAIESSSIAVADIGKTCVIGDDNTVSDAATETNDVQLGTVIAIEDSEAWVQVGRFTNTAA